MREAVVIIALNNSLFANTVNLTDIFGFGRTRGCYHVNADNKVWIGDTRPSLVYSTFPVPPNQPSILILSTTLWLPLW